MRGGVRRIRNDYRSLPGTFWSAMLGLPRVYLGPDHLLCLRMAGTVEEARRFYYQDITGFRVERNRRGQVVSALLLIMLGFPWLIHLVPSLSAFAAWSVVGSGTGLVLALLIIHVLRGATCTTWVHTINHTERLGALGRYRNARKVLALLNMEIAQAQGALELPEEAGAVPGFVPVRSEERQEFVAPMPHRPAFMVVTLVMAVASGATSAAGILVDSDVLELSDALLFVFTTVAAPLALIRSYGTDCPRSARFAVGGVVAYLVLILPIALFMFMVLAAVGVDMSTMEKNLPDMGPTDGPIYYVIFGIESVSAVVLMLLGFFGLVGLRLGIRRSRLAIAESEVTVE